MKGYKTYLQPVEMVLNAIHDIAALQKGKISLCDTSHGLVSYWITMYGEEMEYSFNVTDLVSGCSRVTIELATEKNDYRLVDNEFALLDYAMLNKAKIDFTEQETWDKQVTDRIDKYT